MQHAIKKCFNVFYTENQVIKIANLIIKISCEKMCFISDKSKNVAKSSKNVLMDMKSYMNQMDRELGETDVGQSFERLPPRAKGVSFYFSSYQLILLC